jgi:hypothetical protein
MFYKCSLQISEIVSKGLYITKPTINHCTNWSFNELKRSFGTDLKTLLCKTARNESYSMELSLHASNELGGSFGGQQFYI